MSPGALFGCVVLLVVWCAIGFGVMFPLDAYHNFYVTRDLTRKLPRWAPPAEYLLVIFWPAGLVWYCYWRKE